MDANGIIGREYEQKLILERCKSNKAELIAIYGRRRVGKTSSRHLSLQLHRCVRYTETIHAMPVPSMLLPRWLLL